MRANNQRHRNAFFNNALRQAKYIICIHDEFSRRVPLADMKKNRRHRRDERFCRTTRVRVIVYFAL